VLKELLKQALLEDLNKINAMPIYLQFSAGCDSTALFFSMLDLREQFPFTCITYYYQQRPIYLNKINTFTRLYKVPLKIYPLTQGQVLNNIAELRQQGFKGKVLLDCLAGHLPITKALTNCVVVNGSYADVLYGSYFFQFRLPMTHIEFNQKRLELLNKPDQDGVQSLRTLFARNNNILLTPFGHKAVIGWFLTKTFDECGGIKKTLFNKEFSADLAKLPFKIRRQSQQIESGIRDLRKKLIAI
jgi:hypothetical protein